MNNKNILFFLIFILIYLNIFVPLSEENRHLQKKIIATQNSIQKDKLYILNKEKIIQDINESITLYDESCVKYFYQENSTKIFNIMQKEIKNVIVNSNTHEDNIKWGEIYKEEEITLFPISVRITGAIKNIGKFFETIYSNPKIYIKNFTIRNTKKFYVLELSLYGMKKD